ncbi:MAG: hypothetical protein V1770_00805 [bacterium]
MKIILKILKSPILYLTLIAVGFFFIYSYPRMTLPLINLSPDENANYYFTKLFAEKNTLMSYEGLNEGIAPIVHPRSINVNIENYLVPGSFLGMLLIYGFLARIFGSNIIIYLTPFFACCGALFFYGIIKRIFSWQAAFISSCLMLAHPAFWYYSTRSMFHNVLFMSLVIIGTFFLMSATKTTSRSIAFVQRNPGSNPKTLAQSARLVSLILAGLFIGLALIVRTAEAPWVLGMLFLIWLFYFKKIKFFEIILAVAAIILPFILVFHYNQILYENPILTGYANLHRNIEDSGLVTANTVSDTTCAQEEGVCKIEFAEIRDNGAKKVSLSSNNRAPVVYFAEIKKKIKNIIKENIPSSFALNLNFVTAAGNFKRYYLNFFEWLSLMTLAGIIFFIAFWIVISIMHIIKTYAKLSAPKNFVDPAGVKFVWKAQCIYLLLFTLISLYLIIYYGSWIFHDTPDPNLITIGTSYTRYWLPIYIMGLPFIGFIFSKISDMLKYRLPKFFFLFISSLVLISYSALLVYNAPYEGIKTQINGVAEYNYKKEKVLELTEKNAVIIGSYYDKIFFPYRHTITSKMYDDESVKNNLLILFSRAPLYYYSFGLEKDDIDFINRAHLSDYGVKLFDGKNIFNDEWLWKIVKK